MIEEVAEALFNKRQDLMIAGDPNPVLTVVFSPIGHANAMNSNDVFRHVDLTTRDYETIDGYKFTVDRDQLEQFRIVER